MTYLYVMTFGSFIGYSAGFPLLIRVVFGELPGGAINPNAPNPFAFAWLGPLVGSLARPVGGWLSDKIGGAKVTQWVTVVMILAAGGVGYFVHMASLSAHKRLRSGSPNIFDTAPFAYTTDRPNRLSESPGEFLQVKRIRERLSGPNRMEHTPSHLGTVTRRNDPLRYSPLVVIIRCCVLVSGGRGTHWRRWR